MTPGPCAAADRTERPLAETPADVAIPEVAPPRRIFSIEWNPLPLFTVNRLSGSLVVVPVSHHALVVSPFYTWMTTQPIYVYDDQGNATQLPTQQFSGFGAEVGYRYYTGERGPRGFFVGPSLVAAAMTAHPQTGADTSYLDYGLAIDVGYETLVADAVALSLGAGVQYTRPDQSIPSQQFPADIVANSRVFPRVLLSIGWAP